MTGAARDKELLHAVRIKSYTETKRLLAEGADVNVQDAVTGRTPLHEAVSLEMTDFLRRRLLEAIMPHKPDVNRPDSAGATPLHAATERALKDGKTEAMQLLLDNDANSLMRDLEDKTALDRAREGFHNYYMTVITFLEEWERNKPPARKAQEQEAAVFDLQHSAAEEAQARLREQARKGPRLKL